MKKTTGITTTRVLPRVTLDQIVASTPAASDAPPGGALRRATVRARLDDDTVEVLLPDRPDHALTCDLLESVETAAAPIREGDDVVVLVPERGPSRGCILGRVRRARRASAGDPRPEVLLLEAVRELVLRVGEGSITIRADGKILIKGKDLVSHAKRLNRIRGGSVSLN